MALFSSKKNGPIRPHQIGNQLPYFEFDDDEKSRLHRVHLLKDGALGVCWKTPVPPSYSHDDGHLQTINELRTFLEAFQADYECQVIITTHNNLVDKMRQYLDSGASSERAQILRHARAEKLLEAGFSGYQVSEQGFSMLRDTYMIITLRAPDFVDQLGLIGQISNGLYWGMASVVSVLPMFEKKFEKKVGTFLKKFLKVQMADFQEVLTSAESTLTSMFDVERMSLEEIKEHYWTAFCPSYREPGQKVTVDANQDFAHQVFPMPIENEFEVIKIGNDYHGVIMMAMMPDQVDVDYLGVIRRTLATQHTVFFNIALGRQATEKLNLTLKAEVKKRMSSFLNKEEAEISGQEASEVKGKLFHGRKIMYTMLGIIVHGYSKQDVEDRLLRLNSNFKKLSVVPDVEKSMTLQAISYSWPLVWRNQFTQPFARTRRVLSDDLADLVPIHGHWQGHKNAQAVYINRDGEITFFDHTSNDFVNWHYAITGTSGSGKSFAVVDLTLQLFAAGIDKQYLLTIKDDYDRFAKTMGKLVIIDLDSQDACINPFGGAISKHRLQQWSTAVELMLQKGGEDETGREEQRLVEQVVQFAYELVPEGDVLRPTWIREAFYKFPYISEEQRAIGMQDAEEIGSFCEDGIYGKLFDGWPTVTDDDRLVVFNLQNVLSEKISDVIIFSVFTMLDNIMYMGERAHKKHLLVDEMISMVSAKGGQAVANQLKRAFRTYRSLNCMCGIASQNEEDLTTEVGQAIIGNITKRMILKPRREMIPMLMESLSLRSERHRLNIQSLETKPGFYSEFYLVSPHGEVVCRLLTDRLTYALATTTPDDVVELERLRQENGDDWWQATLAFAQKYPHGVRAYKAAKTTESEA